MLVFVLALVSKKGILCCLAICARKKQPFKRYHPIYIQIYLKFSSYLLAFLGGYYTFIIHITLVADYHLGSVFIRVLVYISEPLGDAVEWFAIGDVVHEHDAHGAAVVRGCDRVEALLARSVPNLQLYLFALNLNCLYLEIDSWNVFLRILRNSLWWGKNFLAVCYYL